ncbi:MAG TPA: DUF642 domain-containing protein [Verrucomicrobiae bacterium]|jgi:choice-of-anchor C domain-containing protein|nr:DUF642 domain-containing protein [Verrucomicrobiae bacterium]
MTKISAMSLAALSLTTSAALAGNITIANGDFSTPTETGTFTTMSGNDLPGWTIGADTTIDHIGNYWQAPPPGGQSVDLDGSYTASSIFQDIYVPVAGTVTVNFWLAGNPDGGDPSKSLAVWFSEEVDQFSFSTSGHDKNSMGWTYETATFIAPSAATYTLAFRSQDDPQSAFGPVIAGVTANASGSVPDAGLTAVLLGAAVTGLGALRRKIA